MLSNIHVMMSLGWKVGPVIKMISPPAKVPMDGLAYTGNDPILQCEKIQYKKKHS